MEPTIYKPSIYKGAGIYNTGAGGGGGEEIVNICGKDYPVVKIGSQKWLGKDLEYISDDFSINPGTGLTTPAIYYENESYLTTYGILYNFYSAEFLEQNKSTLFPGWHVPTMNDFNDLFSAIGGIQNSPLLLRASSWGGSDVFGFSALPKGFYEETTDTFTDIGVDVSFLSTQSYDANNCSYWYLKSNQASIYNNRKTIGYSIRLIKDP